MFSYIGVFSSPPRECKRYYVLVNHHVDSHKKRTKHELTHATSAASLFNLAQLLLVLPSTIKTHT